MKIRRFLAVLALTLGFATASLAQDGSPVSNGFIVALGQMEIAGLDGRGETLSVEKELLDRQITIGIQKNRQFGVNDGQTVAENMTAYALFNTYLGARDKWQVGVGAAILDHETQAFGIAPVFENTDNPVAFAVTAGRFFGASNNVLVRWKHFSTAGLTENNRGINGLEVAVRFGR